MTNIDYFDNKCRNVYNIFYLNKFDIYFNL